MKPDVTVAVVADYESDASSAHAVLRETLAALAGQTGAGDVEFLLGDSAGASLETSDELRRVLPGLRIRAFDATGSYELKNACMQAASADLVAILDADCTPSPGWLAALMNAARDHPDAAAISGRTTYAGRTFTERGAALLTRSYSDPGRAGPTRFVSNNNALWRRSAYLAHPLPVGLGPFASRLQSEALLRSGHSLLFEPAARVVHGFDGWAMERDLRRHIGFATVATRLHDARMPWARLVRSGPASIPLIAAGKTIDAWRDCLRCAPAYGVRWRELPVVLAAAVAVQALEIPGMWQAYRGGRPVKSAYR